MSEHRQNGVIRFSSKLAEHIMPEINIEDTNLSGTLVAQSYLRSSGYFDELHKRLLLPEYYAIIGIYFEHLRMCWDILVYSPEIKETGEGLYLPHVEPIYRRLANGENELVRIHIEYDNSNDRVLRVD